AVATIMLSLHVASGAFDSAVAEQQRAALAVAACALVALSAAWSRAARTITALSDADILAVLDWFTAASVALACVALAAWLHATHADYAYTLTGVALA